MICAEFCERGNEWDELSECVGDEINYDTSYIHDTCKSIYKWWLMYIHIFIVSRSRLNI